MEILRGDVNELMRRMTALEADHAVLKERVQSVKDDSFETKNDVKELHARLFGSLTAKGEIYQIKEKLVQGAAILSTCGILIEFLFGSGTFSLKALITK